MHISTADGFVRAAPANPFLARCCALVEAVIGHKFRVRLTMADVLIEAGIPTLLADIPTPPRA